MITMRGSARLSRTDEKERFAGGRLGRLATRTRWGVGCLGWIRTTTSLTQNQEAYRLADQAKRVGEGGFEPPIARGSKPLTLT